MTVTDPVTTGAPGTGDLRRPGVAPRAPRRRPRSTAGAAGALWLLAPGGLLTVAVIVVPFTVAIIMSLLDLDQYSFRQWLSAPFIGLGNYAQALAGTSLLHAVWVSGSAAVVATLLALPLGVAAALTTHLPYRGRAVVRSLYLIPYVLPAFVVGIIWRIILQPDGVANHGLAQLGIDGGLWLNGPKSYLALILVQTWSSWPLIYLLALSGLQGIDGSLHEAAALDGAEWAAKLRYVVLPLLRGPISLALIISLLHMFNSFTLPFVMFGVPAPQDVEVLPVLTYVESFQNLRFGLSAAMAVISLVLILVPLLVYLRTVKLDTEEASA
ncbi:sugar ABC transporter permease [Micromonospora sp. R77]|uniref:carbohydrate ABC transporter permease n=1 Tax=Micromonospora sp. R77 TaxID=2925836 RepID=UPI001F609981|nr:sugar ABC transporter permease [Micromonospora sp. R77]MCI4066250.1 sugar ABC transporter permease [Micromonospora sp. R77]